MDLLGYLGAYGVPAYNRAQRSADELAYERAQQAKENAWKERALKLDESNLGLRQGELDWNKLQSNLSTAQKIYDSGQDILSDPKKLRNLVNAKMYPGFVQDMRKAATTLGYSFNMPDNPPEESPEDAWTAIQGDIDKAAILGYEPGSEAVRTRAAMQAKLHPSIGQYIGGEEPATPQMRVGFGGAPEMLPAKPATSTADILAGMYAPRAADQIKREQGLQRIRDAYNRATNQNIKTKLNSLWQLTQAWQQNGYGMPPEQEARRQQLWADPELQYALGAEGALPPNTTGASSTTTPSQPTTPAQDSRNRPAVTAEEVAVPIDGLPSGGTWIIPNTMYMGPDKQTTYIRQNGQWVRNPGKWKVGGNTQPPTQSSEGYVTPKERQRRKEKAEAQANVDLDNKRAAVQLEIALANLKMAQDRYTYWVDHRGQPVSAEGKAKLRGEIGKWRARLSSIEKSIAGNTFGIPGMSKPKGAELDALKSERETVKQLLKEAEAQMGTQTPKPTSTAKAAELSPGAKAHMKRQMQGFKTKVGRWPNDNEVKAKFPNFTPSERSRVAGLIRKGQL